MSKNDHPHKSGSSIWSTFVLGILFGSGAMYFLGTKKGRLVTRQLLDILEELELSAGDMISELEENLENHESPITMKEKLESILPSDKIDTVLHKIKHVLPLQPQTKNHHNNHKKIGI